MLTAVATAFKIPDLRAKILFTLGMLVIFRFFAAIPVPGVNREGLQDFIQSNALLGILNIFSGNSLQNFSIVALGVYPYITASIIMQLMTPIIPSLNELSNEGQVGATRSTSTLAHRSTSDAPGLWSGVLFSQQTGQDGLPLIEGFGFGSPETILPTLATLLTMTAGTMLLVWMGELITEFGIGNGISIIIFGGIVASLPGSVMSLFAGPSVTSNVIGTVMFLLIGLLTIVGIVLINEGQRRIPVHHAKRVRSGRMYGGNTTFIPLKVNSAGMIPLIFAVSILVFPGLIAQFLSTSSNETLRSFAASLSQFMSPNTLQYNVVYFVLVVAFTYFYTMVIFQQQKISENLQRQGAFIPGVRPEKTRSST